MIDKSRIVELNSEVLTGTIELGEGILVGNLADADSRGYSIQYLWNGTKLGIKTENQTEYQFVELKGNTGTSIENVFVEDYFMYVRLSDGQTLPIGNVRGPEGHVDITAYKDIPDAPTKISYFENDKSFLTAEEVRKLVAEISHLQKEIVNVLPATEEAKDNVMYLVPKHAGVGIGVAAITNDYNEYILVGTDFELIGSTTVDLTGYVKEDDITALTDDDFDYILGGA